MTTLRNFGKNFLGITAVILALLSLARAADAGFEWNPPTQAPAAAPSSNAKKDAPPGALTPAPVGEVSAQPAPLPLPATKEAPLPAAETVKMPANAAARPAKQAQQKPQMKTLTFVPAALPEAVREKSLPAPKRAPTVPATNFKPLPLPESAERDSLPAAPLAESPLPEKAPGLSHKLSLNPYPLQNSSAATVEPPAQPVQNEAAQAPEGVTGFGEDMPLALALQQIAPPGHVVVFGPGVNAGTRVSWDGKGRSWEAVIADLLQPLNLKASFDGGLIRVGTAASAADTHAAAGPATLPPPENTESAQELPLKISSAKNPATDDLKRQRIMDPGQDAPQAAPKGDGLPGIEPASGGEPSAAWQARKGASLRETLTEWSNKARVKLDWATAQDYALSADVTMNGSFGSAIKTVYTKALSSESARPTIKYLEKKALLTVKDPPAGITAR